ncbi:hypothetical protein OHA61_39640 [Streptomyces sp. NBC_00885]|uniref:hypothetical protein n=1 Tax=Streptomyces sp. NBC_00885 TaxID=2975857 RepID=UPI0038631C10|nr:hypothetical protein OHA61_00165 [Streptomyces sp. NBC_00885]WSY72125.1 hypothetical protein OHA61_39640 [Streptomyces sp. NBC_00885]
MSSARQTVKTVRNDRVQLTDAERATIDLLNASVADVREPEGCYALAELRKSLTKETREALGTAIPDPEERGRAQIEQIRPELEKLKGTAWPVRGFMPLETRGLPPVDVAPQGPIRPLPRDPDIFLAQPPHVGEWTWTETSTLVNAPSDTLTVDVDSDRYRIFGHIGYASDDLFTGTVGLAITYILPPERMPRTDRTVFVVEPEVRLGGDVSGWTGPYHPIWHADDKWSKCWRFLEATLTLSNGERLAEDSYSFDLFLLDDVIPVGRASVDEFFGWGARLTFAANMADLRRDGHSIFLRIALRYDFQLEGESDIWFRNRPGSASESVPAFDNALTFRVISPGFVPI